MQTQANDTASNGQSLAHKLSTWINKLAKTDALRYNYSQ
jgi:hypothetical protein